jgi:ribosomal protein S18 acetylase RimI-like enzyme
MSLPEIRDGRPEDTAELARLVMLSDTSFLPLLFGGRLESALRQMLARRRNLFSHKHTRVVEHQGQTAGVLLGYSYEQMRREALFTGVLWLRLLGSGLLRRLPGLLRLGFSRSARQDSARWLSPGEYYISNLAVGPEFRRQGLGARLLDDCRQRAERLGCRRVALDVDAGNEEAMRLYSRMGYEREKHSLRVGAQFEFARLSRSV